MHGPAALADMDATAPPREAWTVVILLSLMLALSFIDRLVLNILADPLSQALGLSDGQLGLLMGTGFAVVYSITGLPLAQLIDGRNRKRLVIFGVTLWSAMTILSAFASDFSLLLIARSGVGIGEAVLTPAAGSMIADLFIKPKRAFPMGLYMATGSFMGTASFLVGGAALALATALAPITGIEPWRMTFLIVGAPGLILAVLFQLLTREPDRQPAERGDNDGTLAGFVAYLAAHWWFYLPLMMAAAASCLFIFSMLSWTPTILVRAHGFSASEAGMILGGIVTPIKLAALVFWPWLAMRIERRRPNQGVPVGLFLASVWAIPFFIAAPLVDQPYLFALGMSLSMVTTAAWATLPQIGFQLFGPRRMVARLSALVILAMNLVGYGLGPVLTPRLGELWEGLRIPAGWGLSENPLARGLATQGLISVPIILLCTWLCVRTGRRLPAA